jgi:hypothetical protein
MSQLDQVFPNVKKKCLDVFNIFKETIKILDPDH